MLPARGLDNPGATPAPGAPARFCGLFCDAGYTVHRSKFTALVLGWVEDSFVRTDSRGFGVARMIRAVRFCFGCLVTAGPRSS
jgi:hypothetical protein